MLTVGELLVGDEAQKVLDTKHLERSLYNSIADDLAQMPDDSVMRFPAMFESIFLQNIIEYTTTHAGPRYSVVTDMSWIYVIKSRDVQVDSEDDPAAKHYKE